MRYCTLENDNKNIDRSEGQELLTEEEGKIRWSLSIVAELCFGRQDSISDNEVPEAMIIFGAGRASDQHSCGDHFRSIARHYPPKVVYVTGGIVVDKNGMTESERIMAAMWPGQFPDIEFRIDRRSTNTLENVIEAKRLGLDNHARVVFISKWFHCGRCRLTLEKLLRPEVRILQRGYVTTMSEAAIPGVIEPDLWRCVPQIVSKVWKEFEKIEEYGTRGQISYPEEIRGKVLKVRNLVGNWRPPDLHLRV